MTVCRGCCCGTHLKHPTVDHDAQLRRLRDQIGTAGQVRVSTCLGPCQRSNVAVVTPSLAARRAGARAAWLGWVLDDTTIDAIAHWIRTGGPGITPPPDELTLHQFPMPRRTGSAFGELTG